MLVVWLLSTAAVLLLMAVVLRAQREIAQYHPSAFESAARKALASGAFDRAVRITTGAVQSDSLARPGHIGKALLLRAEGQAGRGAVVEALEDLEACAARWRDAPWDARPADLAELRTVAVELALRVVSAEPEDALRALSAAGRGAGEFVEYLYKLKELLPEDAKSRLWPEEPFLVIEDFEGADAKGLVRAAETQGRTLLESRLDERVAWKGRRSAFLEVSGPAREGQSWYALPTRVALSRLPFALRLWVREEHASSTSVRLAYWFETAHASAGTVDGPTRELGDGWELFDIRRDFGDERREWAEKEGYPVADGTITSLVLAVEGGANRFWLDRVEVYLPDNEKPM